MSISNMTGLNVARLPVPGGDDGVWGDVLNDFLSVEHNANGTLKSSGSLSTKASDSAVVHNTGAETIAGVKTFSSSPVVPDGSFAEAKVTNLTTDLAAKADASVLSAHQSQTTSVHGITDTSKLLVNNPGGATIGNAYIANDSGVFTVSTSNVQAWRFKPVGILTETLDRANSQIAHAALPISGTLGLTGILLNKGMVINTITYFTGGTAPGSVTHFWYSLWDGTLNRVGITADAGIVTLLSNTVYPKTLTSPYTVPTTGIYYVGALIVCSTVGTWPGMNNNSTVLLQSPARAGQFGSGLTDPASCPASASPLVGNLGTNTALISVAYATVS
jgi:hypothetical protein